MSAIWIKYIYVKQYTVDSPLTGSQVTGTLKQPAEISWRVAWDFASTGLEVFNFLIASLVHVGAELPSLRATRGLQMGPSHSHPQPQGGWRSLQASHFWPQAACLPILILPIHVSFFIVLGKVAKVWEALY